MKLTEKLRTAFTALWLVCAAVAVQALLATSASALTTGSWAGSAGPKAANQFYGYPYPNAPDCQEDARHPGKNCGSVDVDGWGFYKGQCTSWAAYRLNRLTGAGFSNRYKGQSWGNANHWRSAAEAAGIAVDGRPAVGSVAWYSSGHVAIVEHVNSRTSIVISEMNTDYHDGFAVHTITTAGTWPSAFIHIKDVPNALPAQPTNPSVTSTTATSAVLTWRDVSNNEDGFVSQYRIGSGSWTAGPSVGAGTTSMTVTGLKTDTRYTFQVGARNSVGTHWSAYFYGTTQAQPVPPATYHAGREVTVDTHATGGLSGHKGPGNSYATGPTHPRNTPIWIVCYVNGQSITGPYDTTTIWDLSDDGYYYTDAWLWTGTNGPAVPKCAPKNVTVDSHATGGVSGHKGPGNSYATGPTHAKNTSITIFCYVNGQSITGPYNTTTIWDLSNDGYYYTDAWLWTGTNGPAVPHC